MLYRQMRGDEIDVFIGPTKKKYRLAKKLLCDNSAVFESLVGGAVEEQKGEGRADRAPAVKIKREGEVKGTGVMESDDGKSIPNLYLADDTIHYFEILLEYMMSGKITTNAVAVTDVKSASAWMEYANKYDLQGASEGVYDGIKAHLKGCKTIPILEDDIELFFKTTLPGSPLRTLIVQAAISYKGLRNIKDYSKLEFTVNAYACELLIQTRACMERIKGGCEYKDPLTDSYKRYK